MNRWGMMAVVAAMALSACNSVKREPLPKDANDPTLASIGKQLSDEDKKLLVGYLMRREMAKAFGNQALGDGATTVGDALEAQKKWLSGMSESQQKAEALKAEVEGKRKAVADEINKTVTVAFLNATFVPSSAEAGRFEDYETLSFAVQNSGSKTIKALKGDGVFIDTFGDTIVTIPMKSEEVIKAGEKKQIDLGKEINKFMDDDKKIMNLDGSKKFRFEPTQIVYEDGSTLRAPDAPSD